MRDYLLDISFDSADLLLEETIHSRLYLSASTGNTALDRGGTSTLTAFFDTAADRDEARQALSDLPGVELHGREGERVDWLDVYQQSLHPIAIGEKFIVAPDASLIPPTSSRLTIVVPQEQAFGTGSHETTALCIEMIEQADLESRRALDVGSGSGILALAMVKLGAEKVVAFDNDPDAYGALRDNRSRNGVDPPVMPLFIGGVEALRGGAFDVITMNIIPEVILPVLPQIVARLSRDGILVLSGILTVRRDEVVEAAAAHGLRLKEARERGEWWAGAFGR